MARFPRRVRLLKQADFERAFKTGRREHSDNLIATACENGGGGARLGMALSRRSLRHAVDRNRVKRQTRESFREHQADLPSCDIVITAKSSAAGASREQIRTDLEKLWTRIVKRWSQQSF